MNRDFYTILIQSLIISSIMLLLFVALMTSPARAWSEQPTVALSSPVQTASTESATGEVINEIEAPLSIQDRIIAAARQEGLNERTALRIAKCESSFNPEARSARSSATGLYQFTKGTWRWIGAEAAGMDRTNPDDSIAMFIKFYPKYPGWWECK